MLYLAHHSAIELCRVSVATLVVRKNLDAGFESAQHNRQIFIDKSLSVGLVHNVKALNNY